MDDYYCECPVGRNGKNCNTSTEDAPDPCSANPCGSNGICFTASKCLFFLLIRKIVLVNYLYLKQMAIGAFATTEKTA